MKLSIFTTVGLCTTARNTRASIGPCSLVTTGLCATTVKLRGQKQTEPTAGSVSEGASVEPTPSTKKSLSSALTKGEASDYQAVIVHWSDAHCGLQGWLELDEFDDDGDCIVTTCGFLIPEGEPGSKKNHVTIWQTITGGEGIHPFHIPTPMVKSIVHLTN